MSDKECAMPTDGADGVVSSAPLTVVQRWVERVVVNLNLCPFARRELDRGSVRFSLSEAANTRELINDLTCELNLLQHEPAIETSLLVHPRVLQDFYDFNEFLGDCDRLLRELEFEGVFQIASFHPEYQFAGTDPEDAENYSNRSPYPVLHILREESVARAVETHPDIEAVPATNIALLQHMGAEQLKALSQACLHD